METLLRRGRRAIGTLIVVVASAAGNVAQAMEAAVVQPAEAAAASSPTVPARRAGPAPRMGLEAKAIDLLKATSAQLAAAKSMSFTAVVSYESPSLLGPALVYSTRSEVTLQRPDKLRVLTLGDGPATEFYYDGTTMTAFAPAEKLVATGPAPATIDAALGAAFNDAAIYFPFTDVIVADPYNDLAKGLDVAFYIGRSTVVGGTTTDMVAFGNDNVFAQIWIGADDKLPRKLRAVYLNDPAHLRHDMDLSNWKLNPKVGAGTFATPKAAGATRIAFARPDVMPAGMTPPMTSPTTTPPPAP